MCGLSLTCLTAPSLSSPLSFAPRTAPRTLTSPPDYGRLNDAKPALRLPCLTHVFVVPTFTSCFRSSHRDMVPRFPGEWARDLCGGAVWIPENTIRPSRRRTSLDQPGCTTARARDLLDSCVFHSSPAACAHYVHHGRCVYSMTSRTSHIRQNTELHLLECEGCCGAVSCACLEVKQRWTSHLTQVHRLASWSLGTLEPGARARAIDGRLTSHTQHFACRRLLDNRQANS